MYHAASILREIDEARERLEEAESYFLRSRGWSRSEILGGIVLWQKDLDVTGRTVCVDQSMALALERRALDPGREHG